MKDLFTSYTFNPPGSRLRKKKKARLSRQQKDREVSVSSEARLDEFLDRQPNANASDDHNNGQLTSSNVAKQVFGASSEVSGSAESSTRRKNQQESNQDEEGQSDLNDDEDDEGEDLGDLPTSMETDLNLNHFIECLDIFGGAPALKGPTGSKSDSGGGGGKNDEDDLITEEFRRRARERRERNGEESPERRHQSGGKTSKDDKDRTALRMTWEGPGHPFVLL